MSKVPDREQLLEAASELFGARGIKATSLEDLGATLQLSPAALRQLATSKEDLLFQIASRDVKALVAEGQRLSSTSATVEQLMTLISERAFTFIGARPVLLELMVGALQATMPEWEVRLRELRDRCVQVCRGVLEIGVKQKALRADLPMDLVAAILLELHLAGFAFHHSDGPDRMLRAAQRRTVAVDLFLNGLRPR